MRSIYARLPVSGHYLRKRVRLAGFARGLAAFSILLMVVSVLFFRVGSIVPQALIGLFLLSFALAAVALLVSLYGLYRVWFDGFAGGGKALAALILAAVALTPLAAGLYLAEENPATNAAYTTALAPDEIGRMVSANGASAATPSATLDDFPSVVPARRYLADAPRLYGAARDVLDDLGWPIENVVVGDPDAPPSDDLGVSGTVDVPVPTFREEATAADNDASDALPQSDRYEITARADDPIFTLPSAVTIQISETNGETSVEMQSVSRSTAIDLGQNRRFINDFLNRLDTAMAGLETIDTPG